MGEVCNQQKVNDLSIDNQLLNNFNLQLGMVRDMYDFDGILGLDFMIMTGLVSNFSSLNIDYKKLK